MIILSYVFGLFIGFAFSFFALWVVEKFSADNTSVRNLVVGAVIITIASYTLSFLPIPYVKDILLIGVIMFVLLKISSLRGFHLFIAALFYIAMWTILFALLSSFVL